MRDTNNFAHAPGNQRPNQGENLAWAMASNVSIIKNRKENFKKQFENTLFF